MAKRQRRIDTRLAELEALCATGEPAARDAVLGQALADSSAAVVRLAARLAAEQFCHELIPALVEAFARFSGDDAARRDPNCLAKSAIVKTLYDLDYLDVEFYRRGLRLYQHEPVWGGSVDTAVDVRCRCALGLAATSYGRAVLDLVALLADEAAAARIAAVQALALLEPLPSEAVLRHKALSGDADPAVLGECFAALLKLEPDASVGFVAGFLDADDPETVGEAALALGESRLAAGYPPLAVAWQRRRVERDLPLVLLRALALHRSAEASGLLLAVVREGSAQQAGEAIDALLEVHSGHAVAVQICDALAARRGAPLPAAYQRRLAGSGRPD